MASNVIFFHFSIELQALSQLICVFHVLFLYNINIDYHFNTADTMADLNKYLRKNLNATCILYQNAEYIDKSSGQSHSNLV